MTESPHTTLYILPASSSPLALVIRRGPSKWWHFLLWDRDSGIVSPGSWFNGMIYPHKCDLSPKGDWMAILAYRGSKAPHAWTALCRAPNVSAIVFMPQDTVQNGGGYFDDRSPVLWLNSPVAAAVRESRAEHPYEFGFRDPGEPDFGRTNDRLERGGWKLVSRPKKHNVVHWRKSTKSKRIHLVAEFTGTQEELNENPALLYTDRFLYFLQGKTQADLELIPDADWADWNTLGEICFTRGGCLYTVAPEKLHSGAHLVLDLNGLKPRPAVHPSRKPGAPIGSQ